MTHVTIRMIGHQQLAKNMQSHSAHGHEMNINEHHHAS